MSEAARWKEFESRASRFSENFKNASNERSEAQLFWIRFLEIFGIRKEKIEARFEENIRETGFIDFLWKGKILIEHKSKGKNLDAAYEQASNYFVNLQQRDLPNYICVCDFERFRLRDLLNDRTHEFNLSELSENIKLFSFLLGYQPLPVVSQDEINIKAAKELGIIHEELVKNQYEDGVDVLLARIIFCLFAENTGIFNDNQFFEYIKNHTLDDGSDLGPSLIELFQVLDTHHEKRQANRPDYLKEFEYINGALFSKTISVPAFDKSLRDKLLKLCKLNWSDVSGEIFGSMFQAALDPDMRHQAGAHYTSEEIIQRTIKPLFLDDLWDEFHKCRRNDSFRKLHEKIQNLRFLDPACGCGNFLIIAYKELRYLENQILVKLYHSGDAPVQGVLDISQLVKININQFYGIEIDSFACEITKLGLWLTEHQMNIETGKTFGQYFSSIPLKNNTNIVCDDALLLDWEDLNISGPTFIFGNPPYLGTREQSTDQKTSLENALDQIQGYKKLDFVSGWFYLASKYLSENELSAAAFVSTNSILMGEQPSRLWPPIFNSGIEIDFAYKSFVWKSDLPNAAGVHCVILGISKGKTKKYLFDAELGEPIFGVPVRKINYTLNEGENIFLDLKRRESISKLPKICYGSLPYDNNLGLIWSEENYQSIISDHPNLEKYFKPYLDGKGITNDSKQYCLWLPDSFPSELHKIPQLFNSIKNIREWRLASKRKATRDQADTPYRFGEIRHKDESYIAIPVVSSGNREYLPVKYIEDGSVNSSKAVAIHTNKIWLVGLLASKIHLVWLDIYGGKFKSDYQYSTVIYNNFPVPNISQEMKLNLEEASHKFIEYRKNSSSTIADDYKIGCIPRDLLKIHNEIDRIVDKIYEVSSPSLESRLKALNDLYKSLNESS